MRLLLDTHALIWWLAGDPSLSPAAKDAIADERNEALVSAVSAMEVATKVRLGKLPQAARLAQDFVGIVAAQGFVGLPLSVRHAQLAGRLQHAHRDPFDRMLIAQSLVDDLTLVSIETLFDDFGVKRLW